MNLTLAIQLFRNMGPRYASYRIFHELEKRTGRIKTKHPVATEPKTFISVEEWRALPNSFILDEREQVKLKRRETQVLEEKANRILAGEVLFFSNEWKSLGEDYDWITNPETGYTYDISKHWSEISDFNPANGDIKYVWEKSRFSWLLTLIRHNYHFNQDHSEYIFSQIEDWIDKNPINQGPNWKCSQEISLRVFNWCYALSYYRNSNALTSERWEKIQHTIYWSLHHVFHNINFSRIAVRNNHAITETLCLALSELLFPFIPDTIEWSRKGRKWFEEEVTYQIYEDGTFLQFSMNYHRVVIQLLSFGFSFAEKNNKPFSPVVYERAYKSTDFLYQCLQEENGYLPNYGNNDGALFFPLTDQEYRDFRPQLNTLHKFLTGENLYKDESISEDLEWVLGQKKFPARYKAIQKREGFSSYPIGGFYILRNDDTFTFIRCGNHKDRPAQADNLHLDIWKNGVNVLRDSGTYKYNTTKELQDYFMGTASHNTVRIGNHSQMLKGSRFIWFYWTQAEYAEWEETEDAFVFKGAVRAYQFLSKKIVHYRTLVKRKGAPHWEIKDSIKGTNSLDCFQQWHAEVNCGLNFEAEADGTITSPYSIPSFNSTHYGEKVKGEGIAFRFKNHINTHLTLRAI